jgi:hypothetical protein
MDDYLSLLDQSVGGGEKKHNPSMKERNSLGGNHSRILRLETNSDSNDADLHRFNRQRSHNCGGPESPLFK